MAPVRPGRDWKKYILYFQIKEKIPKIHSQKMKQDEILYMTLRTVQNMTVYGMKYWQGYIAQPQGCERRLLASLAKAGVITQA